MAKQSESGRPAGGEGKASQGKGARGGKVIVKTFSPSDAGPGDPVLADLLGKIVNRAAELQQRPRAGITIKAVVYENPGGGYTAEVPAIPGCVTEGDTWDELRANLREAVELCLLCVPGDYKPLDDTGREQEVEI
jgi:hypothetical protein